MLKLIIKIIVSREVRKRFRTYLREKNRTGQKESEKQVPEIPLTENNMRNCELLLNRSILLSRLKMGGIIAEIGVDQAVFSEQILKVTEPALLHLVDSWRSERYHAGKSDGVTR
jgi:hypothetical protein